MVGTQPVRIKADLPGRRRLGAGRENPLRLRFHGIEDAPEMPRPPGDGPGGAGSKLAIQHGEDDPPHAIARLTHVEIRGILHPGDAAGVEKGRQFGAREIEQRPHEAAPPRGDPRQTPQPGPSTQVDEKSLRQVVPLMPQEDRAAAGDASEPEKRPVSRLAHLRLRREPSEVGGELEAVDAEWDRPFGAEAAQALFLSIGVGSDAVMDMPGGNQAPVARRRRRSQDEERGGVAAARNRDQETRGIRGIQEDAKGREESPFGSAGGDRHGIGNVAAQGLEPRTQ